MAKQRLRDLRPSQWLLTVTPAFAGALAAWLGRKELAFPEPLYIAGGGVAVSLLLGFLMVYGEDL